eukprot:SAG31_NODE_1085_length_10006_cov_34.511154_6_plen_454_part_00
MCRGTAVQLYRYLYSSVLNLSIYTSTSTFRYLVVRPYLPLFKTEELPPCSIGIISTIFWLATSYDTASCVSTTRAIAAAPAEALRLGGGSEGRIEEGAAAPTSFHRGRRVTMAATGRPRIVAVDAPGTVAPGFGGGAAAFEICRVTGAEYKVLVAFDEGTGRDRGTILYKEDGAAQPFDAAKQFEVICDLDGDVFGPGFYELTPARRQSIVSSSAAAKQQAAVATTTAAGSGRKRAHEEEGDACAGPHGSEGGGAAAAAAAAPAVAAATKVARVTGLQSALGRNSMPSTMRDGSQKKLTMRDTELQRFGVAGPPRNFTGQDRAGWSKAERTMFNFQNQMHGLAYASAFMRDYFVKNQGKPLPPEKPPRSGYAIFRSERFAAIGCSAAGFKGEGSKKKNFSKQVGAEWSALAEEAQAPYVAEHSRLAEEHAAAQAAFEVELAQWQDQAADSGAT